LNDKSKLVHGPTDCFFLYVADNSHRMDESRVYKKGPYPTFDAAVAEAKVIVDQFLKGGYKPGMTAEELYAQYTTFGDEPAIVGPGFKDIAFSAWDYAKQQCAETCTPGVKRGDGC
jgi:hypothetical protein